MAYWILLTVTHIVLVVTTGVDSNTNCIRDPSKASCNFQNGDLCGWNNTAGHYTWNIISTGQSGGGDYYASAANYSTGKRSSLQSPVLCPTDVPYTLRFRYIINCTSNRCELLVKMRSGTNQSKELKTFNFNSGWETYDLNITNTTQHSIEFVAKQAYPKGNAFEIGISVISFQSGTTTTTSMLNSPTTALTTTTAATLTYELHTAAATRTTLSHDSQEDTQNPERQSQRVWIVVGVTVSLLVVGAIVAAIVICQRKDCLACHISCHLKATQNTDVTPADRERQSVANPAYSPGEERLCITLPGAAAGGVMGEVNKKPRALVTCDQTAHGELRGVPGGESPYEIEDCEDTDHYHSIAEVDTDTTQHNTIKADSGYELVTVGQASVSNSTPRNVPTFGSSIDPLVPADINSTGCMQNRVAFDVETNNRSKVNVMQDEYNALSHETPPAKPAGHPLGHTYHHLDKDINADPSIKTANLNEYSLAKVSNEDSVFPSTSTSDGHRNVTNPSSGTGKQNQINVNPGLRQELRITKAEYNRLDLDRPRHDEESGAEKAGGHDVYSHPHGDDGEYHQLDFDHDQPHNAEVRSQDNIDKQDVYSHLQADD